MVLRTGRWAVGLVCVATLAAAVPARAAATVDNPPYLSWAKYKPGTSVTMAADLSVNGMKMTMLSTTTLVSVTAGQVKLSVTSKVDMMGQSHPGGTVQKSIPAKAAPATVQQMGTADVTAAGKTYPCKVYQISGSSVDVSTPGRNAPAAAAGGGTAKVYANDDVPGGAVKIEMASPMGHPMVLVLTDVSVK